MVPILCEHESHLVHLSESDSELSDSHPICEIECFNLEDMSDTPSELREVVDRSMEATSHSNNLTSTSSVFSHVVLGSMDDETPIMEKFHLVDEDDAIPIDDEEIGHMEPNTSTTPTSYEWDYKGNNIGVDDAMIPLVDMKNDELHPIACNMLNNCSFPCIARNDDNDDCYVVTTLSNNCSFPRFVDNNVKTLNMFCAKCLQYSSVVASNMMNNCSFQCLVCNNVNMLVNEIAPIAFSYFGDFAFSHVEHVPTNTSHIHHVYYDKLLNVNGDVQMK